MPPTDGIPAPGDSFPALHLPNCDGVECAVPPGAAVIVFYRGHW
jgi:hypothetical protein